MNIQFKKEDAVAFHCQGCRQDGYYFTSEDYDKPHYIICRSCGLETAEVWCRKCLEHWKFTDNIKAQPMEWTCPRCQTSYPLPEDFYKNPVSFYLEKDLPPNFINSLEGRSMTLQNKVKSFLQLYLLLSMVFIWGGIIAGAIIPIILNIMVIFLNLLYAAYTLKNAHNPVGFFRSEFWRFCILASVFILSPAALPVFTRKPYGWFVTTNLFLLFIGQILLLYWLESHKWFERVQFWLESGKLDLKKSLLRTEVVAFKPPKQPALLAAIVILGIVLLFYILSMLDFNYSGMLLLGTCAFMVLVFGGLAGINAAWAVVIKKIERHGGKLHTEFRAEMGMKNDKSEKM